MILQVLPHRQIGQRRDAELAQMIGRTDPREHQQLRRIERSAAQDHFTLRIRRHQRAVAQVGYAAGARAVEHEPLRVRAHAYGEVLARTRRAQICGRRR
jgi:hypothetical protein